MEIYNELLKRDAHALAKRAGLSSRSVLTNCTLVWLDARNSVVIDKYGKPTLYAGCSQNEVYNFLQGRNSTVTANKAKRIVIEGNDIAHIFTNIKRYLEAL